MTEGTLSDQSIIFCGHLNISTRKRNPKLADIINVMIIFYH